MTEDSTRGAHEAGDPHWHPPHLPLHLRAVPQWAARAALESRMPGELLRWLWSGQITGKGLPRAPEDAPPVLLVPGFGFGDAAISQFHVLLRRLGYRTYASRIALNVRCSDATVEHLARVAARVREIEAERGYDGRLAVVGQSRGGMLARGLAARRPDLVELVVNMGGCLNDEFAFYEIPQPFLVATRTYHHAIDWDLREKGCGTPQCRCPYMQAAHRSLPDDVRLVNVYSRQDGVVDWRSCVVEGAENIEVSGSHIGMGFNADAVGAVARVLAGPR